MHLGLRNVVSVWLFDYLTAEIVLITFRLIENLH